MEEEVEDGGKKNVKIEKKVSPSDWGGEADDWAIQQLIRTDGKVNKLHTQVIADFLLAAEENGGR